MDSMIEEGQETQGRKMPWQAGHTGPAGLRAYADSLAPPEELDPTAREIPGGMQSATLVSRSDGDWETVTVTRTRYAVPVPGENCRRCGQPWPPASEVVTEPEDDAADG